MKLLQTYYTSCRKGQSGQSGFQFYSYSDGLTEDEKLEIKTIGEYTAPFDLPSNPSQEEINKDFPIAFHYFKLKSSGRVGIIQSVALIQEYSGRPGNYLAHAFILESGEFPFPPILLYNSKSFKKDLTPEEWNIDEVPSLLPKIELNDLEKNEQININSIRSFLSEKEYESIFSQMVNSVIQSFTNKKVSEDYDNNKQGENKGQERDYRERVILSDEQDNIAYWIASLSFSFPLHIVNYFTFSTYSINPSNSNSLICSTTKTGSCFNFNNEIDYQFKYFIFNVLEDKYSTLNTSYTYAEVINTALTISSYDNIEEFFKFFNNFNYNYPDKDIDLVYKIFSTTKNNSGNTLKWTDFFRFVSKYGTETYLKDFFTTNKNYLEEILDGIENSELLSQFFENALFVLKKTKSVGDFNIIFELYLSWLNMYIFCQNGENFNKKYIEIILHDNKVIINQLSIFNKEFKKRFFDEQTFKLLYEYLSDTKSCSFSAYTLLITYQNIIHTNSSFEEVFKIPSFQLIFKQFVEYSEPEDIKVLLLEISDLSSLVFLLDKLLRNLSVETVNSLIQNQKEPEKLLEEFKKVNNVNLYLTFIPYFLQKSTDKSIYFWNSIEYLNTQQITSLQYECLIKSYLSYNDKISIIDIKKLLNLSVNKKCIEILPSIVELYEKTLSFRNLKDNDCLTIEKVLLLKEKYKITTKNNTCELQMLLFQLQENKLSTVLSAFKKLKANLNNYTDKEFTYFTTIFFNYLIPLIKTEKDYLYIFLFISKITKQNTVSLLKKNLLEHHKKSKENFAIVNLITFYLKYDDYKKTNTNISIKENEIKELIVNILSSIKKSSTEIILKKFKKQKAFEPIVLEVNKKRDNSFFGKIDNLFNNFINKK